MKRAQSHSARNSNSNIKSFLISLTLLLYGCGRRPSRSINKGTTYSRLLLSGLLWLNVNDALHRAPQAQIQAAWRVVAHTNVIND